MRFIITTVVFIFMIQPSLSKGFTTMEEQLKHSIQERSQAIAKAEARAKSQKLGKGKNTIYTYLKKDIQ